VNDGAARTAFKRLLGGIPLAAEASQWLKPGRAAPIGGYTLDRLEAAIPGWVASAERARAGANGAAPRRLLAIGYLKWWLEYVAALGAVLAGLGHQVELAYLPYRRWNQPSLKFDDRRQQVYLQRVLGRLSPLLSIRDLGLGGSVSIPESLGRDLEDLSRIDVQYTLLRERLDLRPGTEDRRLYDLRLARNRAAAGAVWRLLSHRRYDAVLIPNGSILEFGAIYRAARCAGTRVVTFEFGEQRDCLWLAQDAEVMLLDTTDLWEARRDEPLVGEERAAIGSLYRARQGGTSEDAFDRQWQMGESQGAQTARARLGLDPARPVALLCTNVVGDSLSLGREIFSDGMAGWLAMTVRHFAERPQAQLVVRVHPGESFGTADPSEGIVHAALPELPRHVIVVPHDSPVNTYDLIGLAHLGLVYTTTAGIEMAMNGVPVIVAGKTHYRGRGFTCDPSTAEEYLAAIDDLLAGPLGHRLEPRLVDQAWRYAHRFFFEYPFPFPWHSYHFWEDVVRHPPEWVLDPAQRPLLEATLRALVGLPIDWRERARRGVRA
jgi:hypothetical protein